MISTRFASALTGLVLVVGCTHHTETTSSPHSSATPAAAKATADTLPAPVSTQFRRDFPNAGITNITPASTETGAPIYRITYVENGRPGSATYFQNGERLPQPPPVDLTPRTPAPPPR